MILPPTSRARALALRPRARRVRGAQRREVLAAGVRARAPTRATTGRSASSCGRASALPASSARLAGSRERAARQARARGDPRLALRTGRTACAAAACRSRSCARRRTASISARSSRGCRAAGTRDKTHRTSRRAIYLDDLAAPRARLARRAADGLVLIGRRHLRSNNSWMHNSERLVKGPPRCTLLIHPDDAARARPRRRRARAKVVDRRAARSSCPSRSPTTMMPRRRQPPARLGPRPSRARGSASRARRPAPRSTTHSEELSTRCRATRRFRPPGRGHARVTFTARTPARG